MLVMKNGRIAIEETRLVAPWRAVVRLAHARGRVGKRLIAHGDRGREVGRPAAASPHAIGDVDRRRRGALVDMDHNRIDPQLIRSVCGAGLQPEIDSVHGREAAIEAAQVDDVPPAGLDRDLLSIHKYPGCAA
jgi:hypothetical protein